MSNGQNAQKVVMILNTIVLLGLIACLIIAGTVMREGHETSLLLANTKELAQELRQSSDDLTRFIRTYTVTGNYSYWEYFQQVIAIRDGKSPLPNDPWRNHWDLFISEGVAPHGFGKPSALIPRMEDAKFSAKEMELLEESKRQSDALIDLENVAYHAMQGLFRPSDTTGLSEAQAKTFSVKGAPNETLARSLVHSTDYHVWKGKIMRPLDEFTAHSNERVLDAIDKNYRMNLALVGVLAAMLACLSFLLLFYFLKVLRDVQDGIMQDAYDAMEAELARIKAFLPPSMLAAFEQQQEDQEEAIKNDDEGDLPSIVETSNYSSNTPLSPQRTQNSRLSSYNSSHGSSEYSAGRTVKHGKRPAPSTTLLSTDNAILSKAVAVISFNLVDFHQKVLKNAEDEQHNFEHVQKAFLEIVQRCVKEQRGVIDFFQGDHVVATFNAVTNTSVPGKRAAFVALNASAAWKADPKRPPMAVGLSTGKATVGNTGTKDMTRFNIVGAVYSRAVALQAMATRDIKALTKSSHAKAVPQSRIYTTREGTVEFEHEVYWQSVDFVTNLPGRSSEKHGSIVACVEQYKCMKQTEWMYMLEEGETKDPFAEINAAFGLLASKKYHEAKEKAVSLNQGLSGVHRLNHLLARATEYHHGSPHHHDHCGSSPLGDADTTA